MKHRTISEQLRHAIETAGKSRYQLAKESGVDEAALSRFVTGKRGLTLLAVDRICQVLKLKLVADERKAR